MFFGVCLFWSYSAPLEKTAPAAIATKMNLLNLEITIIPFNTSQYNIFPTTHIAGAMATMQEHPHHPL